MTTLRTLAFDRRRALSLLAGATAGVVAAPLGLRGAAAAGQEASPVAGPVALAGGASPIVLVHGSFLGGWCWEEVGPLLERTGRTVAAPDLPGHGADRTPVTEITLQGYVDRIVEVVEAQAAPVVLVGHSMAGIVISQVAEQRPDRVRALVYVTAYLLRDGESLLDAALSDADSLAGPLLKVDQAAGVASLAADVVAPLFFHDAPLEVARRAAARSQPEPLAPLATPIAVTEAGFGRVPRLSVETLTDRVVSLPLQRRMQAALPGGHVVAVATGHAPFFAQPDQLASLLTLV